MGQKGLVIGMVALVIIVIVVITGIIFFYDQQTNLDYLADVNRGNAQQSPVVTITSSSTPLIRQEETAPLFVKSLCTSTDEHEFVTAEGYHAVFSGKAIAALRCNDGRLWQVSEESSIPDSAIFFFDGSGTFLDLCQGLFRPEGCTQFAGVVCDQRNYCAF